MSLETHFLQVGSNVREHRVRQFSIMTCSPFGILTQRLSHSSPGLLCTIKKVGKPGVKRAILPPGEGSCLILTRPWDHMWVFPALLALSGDVGQLLNIHHRLRP